MLDSSAKEYLKTKDFLVSGEEFKLVFDSEIELLFTIPKPMEKDLAGYYESEEYISHTDSADGLLAGLYQIVKKWSLRKKTSLIFHQNSGPGSLLDIGAGTGDFLKMAKTKGWEVHGMEPNEKACALALKKGLDLKSSVDEFAGQQFDVVTLWHVLEHVPNLEATILNLEKLVKPLGSLIIAVPNYKSYDARHYGKFWAAYDVPRHLWHFSKRSIQSLFGKEFKLEKTKPMVFDSFYVSLLSEKYKNGNSFSLKAFWIGLRSNIHGLATKEYSSHIYCLRKLK